MAANAFTSQKFVEEEITNPDKGVVGNIRVKPSGILWKPRGAKGATPYYRVPLDKFVTWITDPATGATKQRM